MKSSKGANTQKELSYCSSQSSSRVFHRRRNVYLPENTSSKSIVQSYNRSRVPRLRWTYELHQCFVNAVQTLGGEAKATPKMILPMMNVKGLTLSHIKSHLQMFRSMKNDVIFQEAPETKQAENGIDDNHLCCSQHKYYHGGLANIKHEPHYKYTMHNGILASKVNWKCVDMEANRLIINESSTTTVSRKKEVAFISNEVLNAGLTSKANDDINENAQETFVAYLLSSSSVVDIELTLGGPYAS